MYSIAASDSSVFAAGFFSSIGGQARSLLAELNPNDGSFLTSIWRRSGFGAFALAVASDGTLYVGGSFRTFELAAQQQDRGVQEWQQNGRVSPRWSAVADIAHRLGTICRGAGCAEHRATGAG